MAINGNVMSVINILMIMCVPMAVMYSDILLI